MELDGRTREILKAVIFCYTKDAFPVGSRTITKNFNLGISPATVRNVMADLEEMGFLIQPHTSAGRVPTEKAYRYYVDHLLEEERDSKILEERFTKEEFFPRTGAMLELLQETSRTLSQASRYTALVMTPRFGLGRFKQIGFVRLKRCQVMAISVTEDGLLQSRILETEEEFSQKQLNRIANHLNQLYGGLSLEEVRRDVLMQMREVKDLYDQMMAQALTLAKKAMVNLEAGDLYVEGTANILDLPEFADATTMKGLLNIFNEKASMLKLLDTYLDAEGVQVFIGSENPLLGLSHFSLVVSNYRRGSQVLGTLGVLGPIRMEYSKVIPLVDSTAKRLSHLLEEMV
jgi:heat-inducible transcriptional repressor